MPRTLILTSPPAHGDDVLSMQKLLRGDSGPYANFMQQHAAPVDGEWREGSAGAARSAKYSLGFPLIEIPKDLHAITAGDLLRGYLQMQPSELPPSYQKLRASRLSPQPTSVSIKALEKARTYIGYHEGANNDNQFGVWYGFNNVAWCAIFQTFCWVSVGSKTFLRSYRYAYVPALIRDAMASRYGLRVLPTPVPGCLVCFLWSGWDHEQSSHIGIVDHALPGEEAPTRASWYSIEGNTSPLSRDAGGGVERNHHTINDAAQTYFISAS